MAPRWRELPVDITCVCQSLPSCLCPFSSWTTKLTVTMTPFGRNIFLNISRQTQRSYSLLLLSNEPDTGQAKLLIRTRSSRVRNAATQSYTTTGNDYVIPVSEEAAPESTRRDPSLLVEERRETSSSSS